MQELSTYLVGVCGGVHDKYCIYGAGTTRFVHSTENGGMYRPNSATPTARFLILLQTKFTHLYYGCVLRALSLFAGRLVRQPLAMTPNTGG